MNEEQMAEYQKYFEDFNQPREKICKTINL